MRQHDRMGFRMRQVVSSTQGVAKLVLQCHAHIPKHGAAQPRAIQAFAARGMFDLAASLGAPTALKDIGMPEGQLDWCAEIATQNAYANPRPIEKAAIRALLEDAYHGKRP
jgi:alcohol dehydrogenase class IV